MSIQAAPPDARQGIESVATNGTSLVTFDKGERGKPELDAIADRLGVQSFAIVPMHARGKVVGALAVGSNEPAAFEDEEIALIASLADTAATATESHHLHADAARTEAVMSLVYDNIEDVIFYIAVEGVDRYRVLFANRAFEQITGVPVAAVVGRLMTEVMPRSSRDIVLEKYRTAITSGEKVTWEYAATYPKGVKIGEVTVCPVFNARGVCTNVVSTVHDVTTRKNTEREREELQSKIVSSQRLQALGTLAGGIAHDFNNVLSVILGYADLVGRELPADGVLAEDVREIQKAATRASDMTRQLLAFSRQQVLEPRVLDPNRAIGDMKRMLERLLGATVELTVDTNAKTANIRVDPTQLEQIVMNLAINARDAMPHGGKLTIVTSGAVLDADYARTHPGATAGRYVMIAVADNGIGMDATTQARIFEPFFTTKERGKGTGLGLATVFGIVKQSGGNIWLQSEPGKGTQRSKCIYLRSTPLSKTRAIAPFLRTPAAPKPCSVSRTMSSCASSPSRFFKAAAIAFSMPRTVTMPSVSHQQE